MAEDFRISIERINLMAPGRSRAEWPGRFPLYLSETYEENVYGLVRAKCGSLAPNEMRSFSKLHFLLISICCKAQQNSLD